jgi:hypothetical protein
MKLFVTLSAGLALALATAAPAMARTPPADPGVQAPQQPQQQ